MEFIEDGYIQALTNGSTPDSVLCVEMKYFVLRNLVLCVDVYYFRIVHSVLYVRLLRIINIMLKGLWCSF